MKKTVAHTEWKSNDAGGEVKTHSHIIKAHTLLRRDKEQNPRHRVSVVRIK